MINESFSQKFSKMNELEPLVIEQTNKTPNIDLNHLTGDLISRENQFRKMLPKSMNRHLTGFPYT